MQPTDLIVIAVIALIIGVAVGYIVKAKKNGKKCIGCPYECSCKSKGSKDSCCGDTAE